MQGRGLGGGEGREEEEEGGGDSERRSFDTLAGFHVQVPLNEMSLVFSVTPPPPDDTNKNRNDGGDGRGIV